MFVTPLPVLNYVLNYNPQGRVGKTVGSTNSTYGWDRENKMVSASDGTSSAGYVYDALGRRVKRTQGSNVEKFTNDGQDVVLDDINSTITKYQNGAGIDEKLKQISGGTSKYFLADHLGSIDAFTNSSGTVTESNSYDSFGNATNGSFSSRYQYTGRELDPLSGINYYRARFYDQNLGRFVSEDPIGFLSGEVNMYSYVGNDPLMWSDPNGLERYGGSFYKAAFDGWDRYWKKRNQTDHIEGMNPKNFQCGPSPFTALGSLGSGDYFQKPYGYDFKGGPCFNHDACYMTCGSDKRQCDLNFYDEMMNLCRQTGDPSRQASCRLRAEIYYTLVASPTFGGAAYSDCQNSCNTR